MNQQSSIFRGIYEFEDPSGVMISAKVPHVGSADLYDGTVVVVRPGQVAIFIYEGKVADLLGPGTHHIKTGNLPIITRLANWKFGFTSPLRCELRFFSVATFLSRRWGTSQPVPVRLANSGVIPIRAFGNFGFFVNDPKVLLTKLIGTKGTFTVTDLEEFIQGQIIEKLPEALSVVNSVDSLAQAHDSISKRIEALIRAEIEPYGIKVTAVQVLSALPPPEVMEAINAKLAMNVIGNKQEYLLYKAANSLDAIRDQPGNDSMQMMLGLMIGKGLMGSDYHEKEKEHSYVKNDSKTDHMCRHCGAGIEQKSNFCGQCGKAL